MTAARRPARSTARTPASVLSDEERAVMREVVADRRRQRSGKPDGEAEALAKIAEMPEADRAIAEGLHALIKAAAPELAARTWYGMPAYAKDGAVVCFVQSSQKFKTRYATLGFSDKANLDEGTLWPTAFAVTALTPDNEAKISALVKRAAR